MTSSIDLVSIEGKFTWGRTPRDRGIWPEGIKLTPNAHINNRLPQMAEVWVTLFIEID